jgi:hypothetical protein
VFGVNIKNSNISDIARTARLLTDRIPNNAREIYIRGCIEEKK